MPLFLSQFGPAEALPCSLAYSWIAFLLILYLNTLVFSVYPYFAACSGMILYLSVAYFSAWSWTISRSQPYYVSKWYLALIRWIRPFPWCKICGGCSRLVPIHILTCVSSWTVASFLSLNQSSPIYKHTALCSAWAWRGGGGEQTNRPVLARHHQAHHGAPLSAGERKLPCIVAHVLVARILHIVVQLNLYWPIG
jgi:hypothetical protein